MGVEVSILFGIVAMIGLGLSNSISKIPSKEEGAVKTVFFRGIFINLILFLILLIFVNDSLFSFKYMVLAFVISLIGYVPLATFYKAMKHGKVGVVSPLANSSVIFTVLFSIIFFNETLFFSQIISIVLIITGIVLISLDFKDLKNSHLFNLESGIPYALITCFLWGFVFFLFKIPVNVIGPILTLFIVELGIMIVSGFHLTVSKTGFSFSNKKVLVYIFLVAFFGAVGGLFYNFGIQQGNVSIIAAITFSNPLITNIFGKIFYKEKLDPQQYLAIALMVLGIILISYF